MGSSYWTKNRTDCRNIHILLIILSFLLVKEQYGSTKRKITNLIPAANVMAYQRTHYIKNNFRLSRTQPHDLHEQQTFLRTTSRIHLLVSASTHHLHLSSKERLYGTTALCAQQQQPTEQEVKKGIDKVVMALRKDSRANQELGKLQSVTIVLGFGLQQMDTILAVRFNASFQRSGIKGLSSVPLPFGLGQSNVSEGRGTMVGQVKASINLKTGKVISCSVFRDLGYGRTFDLKI